MAVTLHRVAVAITCATLTACVGRGATAAPKSAGGQAYVVDDAERFARLIAGDRLPDSATLQREYVDKGTPGVALFMDGRIENAGHLARVLAKNADKYRHAAAVCLPVARTMAPEANRVMARVGALLSAGDSVAPTWILFGGNNSGGHADAPGLAVGLEVICDGQNDPAAIRQVLRGFFAHEVTHTYQSRLWKSEPTITLLFVALAEGVPDFVMSLALAEGGTPPSERAVYGQAHEQQIWREFKADMDAHVMQGNDWMYTKGRGGRPADLGYWIGQRIAESYYARATDKKAALRTLLELKDPEAILRESGYGASW